ncbi:GPI anchor transamidase [Babesia caballi]|uniref:GPI anchor transamidase n=1 Tax=Babesia caballi TaxID=5871 RepID=A0AAV4LQQ6_BABCB|nr:GPI anchor transamidase [Babesia caballi]
MFLQALAICVLPIVACEEYLGGSVAAVGPDTFGFLPRYQNAFVENSINFQGTFKISDYLRRKVNITKVEVGMLLKYKETNAVLSSTSRFYYNYRHVGNVAAVAANLYKLGLISRRNVQSLVTETCLCHPTNTFPGRIYVSKSVNISDYRNEIRKDEANTFLENTHIPYRSIGLKLQDLRFLMTQRFPKKFPHSSRVAAKYRVELDEVDPQLDLPAQFVYMTGHGGNRYFQFQAKDVIAAEDIERYMKEFFIKHPNVHTLMIMDTCQAATLFEGLDKEAPMIWVASSPRGISSYSYNANSQLTVSTVGKFTYYVADFFKSVIEGIKTRGDRASVSRLSMGQLKRHMGRHCPEELSVFHANPSITQVAAESRENATSTDRASNSTPDMRKIYLGEFIFNYRVAYFDTYRWPLNVHGKVTDAVALKGKSYELFNLNAAHSRTIDSRRLYAKMGESGLLSPIRRPCEVRKCAVWKDLKNWFGYTGSSLSKLQFEEVFRDVAHGGSGLYERMAVEGGNLLRDASLAFATKKAEGNVFLQSVTKLLFSRNCQKKALEFVKRLYVQKEVTVMNESSLLDHFAKSYLSAAQFLTSPRSVSNYVRVLLSYSLNETAGQDFHRDPKEWLSTLLQHIYHSQAFRHLECDSDNLLLRDMYIIFDYQYDYFLPRIQDCFYDAEVAHQCKNVSGEELLITFASKYFAELYKAHHGTNTDKLAVEYAKAQSREFFRSKAIEIFACVFLRLHVTFIGDEIDYMRQRSLQECRNIFLNLIGACWSISQRETRNNWMANLFQTLRQVQLAVVMNGLSEQPQQAKNCAHTYGENERENKVARQWDFTSMLCKPAQDARQEVPSEPSFFENVLEKTAHFLTNPCKVADVVDDAKVHGCKGGVGKSTVAAGLALTLRRLGCSVGLCDLDIYGPNLACIIGADESYVKWKQVDLNKDAIKYDSQLLTSPQRASTDSGTCDATASDCGCDGFTDAAFERPEPVTTCLLEPKEVHGVKVMSFAFIKSKKDLGYAAYRGPMLDQIASELVLKTDWGELDYLILDLPPGTGDVLISLMEDVEVSGLVAVSTPHQLSINDLRRGVQLFQDHDVPVICLVENMSYFTCDGCDKLHRLFGPSQVGGAAPSLGVDRYVCLPMMRSANCVEELQTNDDARKRFSEIAKFIMEHPATSKSQGSTVKNEALSDGLYVPESSVPCARANQVDGLVDPPQRRYIDGLSADHTGRTDSGRIFAGATVLDSVHKDLYGVLVGHEVNDFEGVHDDTNGLELLAIVPTHM